jgi:hypothetical protein
MAFCIVLRDASEDLFVGLAQLRRLVLNDNRIEALSAHATTTTRVLKTLELANNPLASVNYRTAEDILAQDFDVPSLQEVRCSATLSHLNC